jgi:hypothetical protein
MILDRGKSRVQSRNREIHPEYRAATLEFEFLPDGFARQPAAKTKTAKAHAS